MTIGDRSIVNGLATVVFALIFKVVPDVVIRWRDVWPGAAVTALLFTIGQIGLAFYLGPVPVMTLNRLDDVIAGLPSAVNLLRLLVARPGLAETLVLILSHAPTLAMALARRPALFDGLIDQSALDLPPDVSALVADMKRRDTSLDFQQMLDHVRHAVGEPDRQGHELGRLARRVAEHEPLIAGALLVDVVDRAALTRLDRAVHSRSDIGRLPADRDRHPAGPAVEPHLGRVVSDIGDTAPHDTGDVDITGRGDLTRDVHDSQRQQAIVRALVQFSTEVGAVVLAEGIEVAEQVPALVDAGVELGQGWHLGVPVQQGSTA